MAMSDNVEAWNGGELAYCRELLRTKGNKSVSRENIDGYLATQQAGALRDGFPEIAEVIKKARHYVALDQWHDARKSLSTR